MWKPQAFLGSKERNSHLLNLRAEKAKAQAQALIMRAAEDRLPSWSHLSSWLGKTGTMIHGTGTFELMHPKILNSQIPRNYPSRQKWLLALPPGPHPVWRWSRTILPTRPLVLLSESASPHGQGPQWGLSVSLTSGDVLCLMMEETTQTVPDLPYDFFFFTLQWYESDTHSVETVLQNLNFDPSHH